MPSVCWGHLTWASECSRNEDKREWQVVEKRCFAKPGAVFVLSVVFLGAEGNNLLYPKFETIKIYNMAVREDRDRNIFSWALWYVPVISVL